MFIFAPISTAFAMAPAITRFASARVKVMLVTPLFMWQKRSRAPSSAAALLAIAAMADVLAKASAASTVVSLSRKFVEMSRGHERAPAVQAAGWDHEQNEPRP